MQGVYLETEAGKERQPIKAHKLKPATAMGNLSWKILCENSEKWWEKHATYSELSHPGARELESLYTTLLALVWGVLILWHSQASLHGGRLGFSGLWRKHSSKVMQIPMVGSTWGTLKCWSWRSVGRALTALATITFIGWNGWPQISTPCQKDLTF